MKKRGEGKTEKKHALRIVIIILLVVVFLSIPLVIVCCKLGQMNKNAVSTVKKPEISPGETATPPALIKADADKVDTTKDFDPALIDNIRMDDDSIFNESRIDKDVVNIMLFGSDVREGERHGRSDTMMILSYNRKLRTAKLVSLLRDTWIYIPNRDTWNRINTAYFFGGVGLAINTVNSNFGMDIQYYVKVDFESLKEIVDTVGGIDVYLTEREVEYINNSAENDVLPVKEGWQHLNGRQTLAHSRNRSIGGDGDWSRTRRQRDVMYAFFKKAKTEKSIASLTALVNNLTKYVETNMSPMQMIDLAIDVVFGGDLTLENRALPFEGTWDYAWEGKMAVIHINIADNKRLLHEYLYGVQ